MSNIVQCGKLQCSMSGYFINTTAEEEARIDGINRAMRNAARRYKRHLAREARVAKLLARATQA